MTENTPTKPVPSPGPMQLDSSACTPASDSPDAKKVKFSESQPRSVFKLFLNKDPNALHADSNVIRNQKLHVSKTPDPDKRRFRDVTLAVGCALDRVASEIFRNEKWSREDREKMIKPHVKKYLGSNNEGELQRIIYCLSN